MSIQLDDLDVLSTGIVADEQRGREVHTVTLREAKTGKVEEFKETSLQYIEQPLKSWIQKAYPCEVLRPGEGWVKGTVRARLVFDFVPDEDSDDADEDGYSVDDVDVEIT